MTETWANYGIDLHLDLAGARVRAGLEAAIRDAVRNGRLRPGLRLPSSRDLAADLGVARELTIQGSRDKRADIRTLAGRLGEIAHEEGFEGRVQLAADGAFANSDCRIEWRGGGVERAEAAIDAALNELFARRFSDAATIQCTEE